MAETHHGTPMNLTPLNIEQLRQDFNDAQPFRWVKLEPFLEPEFARELASAYPSFEESRKLGFQFSKVNEHGKVQVTDASLFPPVVSRLHEILAGAEFLGALEQITGISGLLSDPKLEGGGMHLTGPGGRLDVHIDFNYVADRKWHRRLNILVYLNPEWRPEWGGGIELWDRNVQRRHHAFEPLLNRCVIFETSSISFHGVQPVQCPTNLQRKSFAAYYYTKEPPADWKGEEYGTVFRARPDEVLRGKLLMPLENARDKAVERYRDAKRLVKRVLGKEKAR